jgi:hypothetical protein
MSRTGVEGHDEPHSSREVEQHNRSPEFGTAYRNQRRLDESVRTLCGTDYRSSEQPVTLSRLAIAAALCLVKAGNVSAQRWGVEWTIGGGYTMAKGETGAVDSDHGFVVAAGLHLRGNTHARLGIEWSMERLNEGHVFGAQTLCQILIRIGDVTYGTDVPCSYDSRIRDTGNSLGLTFRWQPAARRLTPYLLVGAGWFRVRSCFRTIERFPGGEPDISRNGCGRDVLAELPLGGGIAYRTPALPVTITLEIRATHLIDTHSGNWHPSVRLGIRTG